jgi:hypothetical protein
MFSIELIIAAALCAWGPFLEGKARPASKAGNLTAIGERVVYKMWEP